MTWWLSPLTVVAAVTLLLVVAWWRRWHRLGWLGLLALGLALLTMTPRFANLLVAGIERRALRDGDRCDDGTPIVLLSGGLQREPRSVDDFAALTPESTRRVFAFAELGLPADRRVAVAGGGAFTLSEASVVGALLQRLRPGLRIEWRDTTSRTTWENARNIARLLPPPRRIAIATSALHLPRARLAFESAGFEVCGVALYSQYLPASGFTSLLPQTSALQKTQAAWHELAGAWVYARRAESASPSVSE